MMKSFSASDSWLLLLQAFVGGMLIMSGIFSLAFKYSGSQTASKQPVIKTVVFDCINIQHAPPPESYPPDHAARYALIRLQKACEQQENALALMQIWESDPTAGAVLEP